MAPRRIDRKPGDIIDGWEILDIYIHPTNNLTYVSAKHHCGRTKEMALTKINNNCATCECERIKRTEERVINRHKHLIGTTINSWMILDILPPNKERSKTMALCECRCGSIKEVNLKNIQKGVSRDCGCGRKKTVSRNFSKDLIGQKFGKLTVLEALEERSKTGHKLYKCLCDCGNEVVLQTNLLTTHHTSSCGCLLSYYNMYISQFLADNEIDFKPEYTVWIGDNYYRFDFYLPQYNLFIEYDGEQHYKPVKYYNQSEEEANASLAKTQEHDRIKNLYCEENAINLLRIPYWEKENIETIINNHLQRLSERTSDIDDATV